MRTFARTTLMTAVAGLAIGCLPGVPAAEAAAEHRGPQTLGNFDRPAAETIVDRVRERYARIRTYADLLSVELYADLAGTSQPMAKLDARAFNGLFSTMRLAYAGSNRFAVKSDGGFVAADGLRLTIGTTMLGQYAEHEMPQRLRLSELERNPAIASLVQHPILPLLLDDTSSAMHLGDAMLGASSVETEIFDGEPYYVVEGRIDAPRMFDASARRRLPVQVWIEPESSLVRRVVVDVTDFMNSMLERPATQAGEYPVRFANMQLVMTMHECEIDEPIYLADLAASTDGLRRVEELAVPVGQIAARGVQLRIPGRGRTTLGAGTARPAFGFEGGTAWNGGDTGFARVPATTWTPNRFESFQNNRFPGAQRGFDGMRSGGVVTPGRSGWTSGNWNDSLTTGANATGFAKVPATTWTNRGFDRPAGFTTTRDSRFGRAPQRFQGAWQNDARSTQRFGFGQDIRRPSNVQRFDRFDGNAESFARVPATSWSNAPGRIGRNDVWSNGTWTTSGNANAWTNERWTRSTGTQRFVDPRNDGYARVPATRGTASPWTTQRNGIERSSEWNANGNRAVSRFDRATRTNGSSASTNGHVAPSFAAVTTNGTRFELAALRGAPVLIHFWSAECSACLETMPVLQRIAERYGDDVVVIGVNLDGAANERAVAALTSSSGVTFPQVVRGGASIADRFDVGATPAAILIDAAGVVRFLEADFDGAGARSLERVVAEALGS